MPGGCFSLVESLQRSVVPFVQTPARRDGNPHQIEAVQCDPKSPDGALQYRGERDIEDVATIFEKPSGFDRLLPSFFRKVHVGPSGEAVLLVPGALSMSQLG